MVLTGVEISNFVKFAAAVKHLPQQDLYLSYDAEADVVYINFHNPALPAYDSELTNEDVLIRYDEEGNLIGLTVLHASKR